MTDPMVRRAEAAQKTLDQFKDRPLQIAIIGNTTVDNFLDGVTYANGVHVGHDYQTHGIFVSGDPSKNFGTVRSLGEPITYYPGDPTQTPPIPATTGRYAPRAVGNDNSSGTIDASNAITLNGAPLQSFAA